MNKQHVIVTAAFLSGALMTFGTFELIGPQAAFAQRPPNTGEQREPGKTVIAPIRGMNENLPGLVNETYKDVLQLQQEVRSLQDGLRTQQSALQKLQTQYANHYHLWGNGYDVAHTSPPMTGTGQ
jgi:hypothetical protein